MRRKAPASDDGDATLRGDFAWTWSDGSGFAFGPHWYGGATLDDLTLKMDRTPGGDGSYETTELVERFTLDGDGLAQETLEYDRAGNLTYDGVFKYQYDAWNRMTRVTKAYRDDAGNIQTGSVLQENEYDGLGRRVVVKITNSGDLDCTQHLYYDGWSLVEVRNGSDITVSQYVWAGRVGGYIDELVQLAHNLDWPTTLDDTCETEYWAMQDANYNVLGVVDDTGKLVERYEYEPYGERRVYTSAGSNDPLANAPIDRSQRLTLSDGSSAIHGLNVFGHQGLQHDAVSLLIDSRRRMRNPVLARFVQRDPLTYVDGTSMYVITGTNPTVFLDPSGLARRSVGISVATDGATRTASWYAYFNGDIHAQVGKTINWKTLQDDIFDQLGNDDCISFILVTSHHGDFTEHLDTSSEMEKFLRRLGSRKCEENKEVRLNSCYEFGSQEDNARMKRLATTLGMKVVGWDDWYAIVPHGKEWTAWPDGTLEQTGDTKKVYEGSYIQAANNLSSGRVRLPKAGDGKPDKDSGKKGKGGKEDGKKISNKGTSGLKDDLKVE